MFRTRIFCDPNRYPRVVGSEVGEEFAEVIVVARPNLASTHTGLAGASSGDYVNPEIGCGLLDRSIHECPQAASESDLPRLTELMNLGRVPRCAPRETPDDLKPYRRALHDIEDGGGGVLVAELDGEVVGVCQLIGFRHLQARGGLCAEIESVHVHPRTAHTASVPRSCGPPLSRLGRWAATASSSPPTRCATTPTVSTSASGSRPHTAVQARAGLSGGPRWAPVADGYVIV
jgi:hypothetical protein